MHRKFVTFVLALSILFCQTIPIGAWSEGGHNIIAIMAFRMLDPQDQQTLISILKEHPQFDSEFKLPEGLTDRVQVDEYIIGRSGYWPDVARKYKEFDRPTWHYQLGATKVIGNVTPPEDPNELPPDATSETQELHVVQAIALNKRILSSSSESLSEKAKAICWLAHLVADIHQPCHAGSLYFEGIIPEGDRGANSIRTKQSINMHALWDGLLGRSNDASDIRRRIVEIQNNTEFSNKALSLMKTPRYDEPTKWVEESRALSNEFVYTSEVLEYVQSSTPSSSMQLELSEEYLKKAGLVSQQQARIASARLAMVWRKALENSAE
jgi:hypothetical protein